MRSAFLPGSQTMPPALILLDITPTTPADRQKLVRALQVLADEDGNLEIRPGVEPDCTVIDATRLPTTVMTANRP